MLNKNWNRMWGVVDTSPIMGRVKKVRLKLTCGDNSKIGDIRFSDVQLQLGDECTGYTPSTVNRFNTTARTQYYNCICRDNMSIIVPYDSKNPRTPEIAPTDVDVKIKLPFATPKYAVSLKKFYSGLGLTQIKACAANDYIEGNCSEQLTRYNGNINLSMGGNFLTLPPWDNKLNVTVHNHEKVLMLLKMNDTLYKPEGRRE